MEFKKEIKIEFGRKVKILKKTNSNFISLMLPPGTQGFSKKKFSPFGLAVWPAIYIYKYIYIYIAI